LLKVHPAPSHGTLTVPDNGAFEYHPDAGFSGVDAFGYILHLGIGQGGTVEATSHQNYLAIGTVTIIVGNPECAVDDSSTTSVNEPQTTAEPGVVDSDAPCADP
jgi:Bacterial Ig domain